MLTASAREPVDSAIDSSEAGHSCQHTLLPRVNSVNTICTCLQAIEQDGDYLKAWQRRALVRKQLGNVLGSLDDLQHALLLAPSSAAISRELRSALHARVHETGLQLPQDVSIGVNMRVGRPCVRDG